MGFEDLPDDLRDRPLTDPKLVADLLDAAFTERDRRGGALCVLICDERACPRVVQIIDQLPPGMDVDERDHTLRCLGGILAEAAPDAWFLVARARPGGLSLTAEDLSWRHAIVESFRPHEIQLLGIHIVTPDGSREIPAGMDSAA